MYRPVDILTIHDTQDSFAAAIRLHRIIYKVTPLERESEITWKYSFPRPLIEMICWAATLHILCLLWSGHHHCSPCCSDSSPFPPLVFGIMSIHCSCLPCLPCLIQSLKSTRLFFKLSGVSQPLCHLKSRLQGRFSRSCGPLLKGNRMAEMGTALA